MSNEQKLQSILSKLTPKLKLTAYILMIIALLSVAKYFNLQGLLNNALDWIASFGHWEPAIFIIIYITATVLLVPGSILTLGAGVLFGVIWGSIYVSIGATIGAACAFLIGRYVARGWVEKKIQGQHSFQAIDEAVGTEGWKIVGLTRLSPLFPFNLLNYVFGITQVSFKDYFLLTWIGIMPGTILYVYLGSLAGSLARLGTSGRSRTPAEWAFYAVGLIATIVVTVYVTHIAKKALANKIAS